MDNKRRYNVTVCLVTMTVLPIIFLFSDTAWWVRIIAMLILGAAGVAFMESEIKDDSNDQ